MQALARFGRLFNALRRQQGLQFFDSRGIQCFLAADKIPKFAFQFHFGQTECGRFLQEFFNTEIGKGGNAAQGQNNRQDSALKCGWERLYYTPNGSGLLGNLGENVDNFSDDLRPGGMCVSSENIKE